jgi:hypothetical protein
MEEYITYLASDELSGRSTPSPGLDSAGAYIARQFASFGLNQIDNSWFQKLELGFISLEEQNHLILYKEGKEKNFNIKDDFIPYEFTGNSQAEGDLVFCGYGIEAPEYGYNDYKEIDVKDKIVLLLRHIPREKDSLSVFNHPESDDYSSIEYKAALAAVKGASGVIIVNDPLNHTSMRAVGFPWPSLSKIIPKDALPLMILKNNFRNIPVVNAGEEFVNYVFGSVDNLKGIQQKLDDEMTGESFEFPGIRTSLKTSITVKKISAGNVTAFIEGIDPDLKDEVLIIGAHYDHTGYRKNTPAGEDSIFNGADDNASGTAGMMAIARAFSQLDKKPKRSVMFIAFAGEEIGLFGSRYYVDNPLFPLENTVAMINLDMIGRNDPDKLYMPGVDKTPELKRINQEENHHIGLSLAEIKGFSGASSDHAPFLRKGIPALFYFTGIHSDYHKVTDEASEIDFIKASRVAQLAFRTALHIANDNARYSVSKTKSLIF